MNKRFLSTLLTGAIFLAATSMFVSCKDYDDDIKNLQAQIDRAALKSEVEALQATLNQVSSTASSALTKAEQALKDAATAQGTADAAAAAAKKAQETADAAGAQAAKAIENAAKAQNTADAAVSAAAAAQAAADAAQLTADAAKAIAEAAATKEELAAAQRELKTLAQNAQNTADNAVALANAAQAAADKAQETADAAATKAEFDAAVETLTAAAKNAQETADAALALAEAAATKAEFDAAVETLTEAAKKAQETADAAAAAAAKAQETADAALALGEAAATKTELADAKEELKEFAQGVAKEAKEAAIAKAEAVAADLAQAIADQKVTDEAQDAAIKEELKKYATNAALEAMAEDLKGQLEELEDLIAQTATEAAFQILSERVDGYGAQIDVLFAAITSVELFASYSFSFEAPSLEGQNFVNVYNDANSGTTINVTASEHYTDYNVLTGINTTSTAVLNALTRDWWNNINGATTTDVVNGVNGSTTTLSIFDGVELSVDFDIDVETNLYSGFNPLTAVIFHGTVAEDSKFGDNEDAFGQKADQEIEYKKGADVKDEAELIIRVNPVNADIANADIRLINSLGEDMNDVVIISKAERYDKLLTTDYMTPTRGGTINSGLWKLTLKAADGVTPEAWAKAVYVFDNGRPVATKKFAVAVNNTVKDNADRFVASTFDFIPVYAEFVPAKEFTFKVNDEWVENVRNRWTPNYNEQTQQFEPYIMTEMQYDWYFDNPELAWNPIANNAPAANATNNLVVVDGNIYTYETRRWNKFVYADVNEPIVLSDFFGIPSWEQEEYNGEQIDYYYVVFDRGNAKESAPSEWNAWKDYQVEGLGVMTKADKKLTMKITSEEAHGDVVGFRVYAVNRDGTLADPDGRAFYVFVGTPGEENKAATANIYATEEQPESETMDVAGWFKQGRYYIFSTTNFSNKNDNPAWITEGPTKNEFVIDNAILTFYDKNGEALDVNVEYGYVSGDVLKDAVKVTFKPNDNIASMLNGATYTIYIRQSETHAGDELQLPYATLAITKVMPTDAKTLQFRPMQEGDWKDGIWISKEGSNKFMAYMIPNAGAEWTAPWATAFEEDYAVADDARDNGFKDLNNIFYNLNNDTTFEFVFSTSLMKNGAPVDLVDENGQGIIFGKPGSATRPELGDGDMPYVLDVATEFINGQTEHAVQVYSNYFRVSTYYDNKGKLVFADNWKVAGQKLTAIYACWHHAMHDVAWKTAPSLQWVAAPDQPVTTDFANITTKNRYNSTVFGLTIQQLLDKGWIAFTGDLEMTYKGQVNPYFVPTYDEQTNKIVFTQKGTQADANPTANHDEELTMWFKDAFGHKFAVTNKVQVKKAASNAPRM